MAATISTIQGKQLNIATYNIRYQNGEDSIQGNGWSKRYSVLCDLIRFYDFDIWGV